MARARKKDSETFKNEFSFKEILEKEQKEKSANTIVIDGTAYSIDELTNIVRSIKTKKDPLAVIQGELPVIKERFSSLLNASNIKVLAAMEKNGVIYSLVTDGEKVLVIKRFQNGYVGMSKGVYNAEVFMGLLKGLVR